MSFKLDFILRVVFDWLKCLKIWSYCSETPNIHAQKKTTFLHLFLISFCSNTKAFECCNQFLQRKKELVN